MKKIYIFVITLMLVLGLSVQARATLTTIGSATYNSSDYNLIYDDDLGIAWLDYTNPVNIWQNQVDWATGLNTAGVLTYNLNPGETMSWSGDWRLPTVVDTGNDGCNFGYSGTDCGYNVDTSTGEMAHLFYDELGNLAYYDTSGNPQAGWGLTNTSPFTNLQPMGYWSGTEYAPSTDRAWGLGFFSTYQHAVYKTGNNYALAVRHGQRSTSVPEPATLLLLGSGLAGIAVWRKRLGRKEGRG